jgi:hypothetical protein
MPQRYRLRLGDGTILQVDKDGLQAWVEDDRRAMVQIAGTQQWRPLREFLAEEESAARLRRALIPPEPRRVTPPPQPEAPPATPPPPPEPEPSLPAFEPVIGAPPVQALAEEPSAPLPPWQAPPETPDAEPPPIRFKPLEDEPRVPAEEAEVVVEEAHDPYAVPVPRAYDAARPAEDEEVGPHDRLEGPLLHVLTAFGTLLSRLLDPLTPLVRDWPSRVERAPRPVAPDAARPSKKAPPAAAPPRAPAFEPPAAYEPPAAAPPPVSVLAEEPARAPAFGAGGDAIPIVPLRPLSEDERPAASAWAGLSGKLAGSIARVSAGYAAASAWVAGLPARLQTLRQGNRRLEPVVPPVEPVRRRAASPAPAPKPATRPPAPLQPPPPIAELPSVRLAEGYEAPEEGDVYEGEEAGWSILPVVWAWTKRIVLLGGLAAAGVLVALNWDTWFPRAAELGQTVFTEIDRQAHSTQRARERDQAFANAVERCPHLAPETIRLVLATSSDGVLEPPDVFQVATDAADRGISALPPGEAAELRGLQHELASRLRPPQRARLAEYDRARATRVVFPFENPAALDLVALGARAMTPARRARLQQLLGKAVAAGLELPQPPPPAAPAEAGEAR